MHGTKSEESSGRGGYAFGPFVVDPVKRRLWREGVLVPITSKTFDVLVVLLAHRDHVVSKDELLNRVWPNTAVHENNLARQISSLRRALGQRPDQHDYVVTVPGHGYRFVASVKDLAQIPPEWDAVRDVTGSGSQSLKRTSSHLAPARSLPDQPTRAITADDDAGGRPERRSAWRGCLSHTRRRDLRDPCNRDGRGTAATSCGS